MNAYLTAADKIRLEEYINKSDRIDYGSAIESIIKKDCFTHKELNLLRKIEHRNMSFLYITKIDNKIRFFLNRDSLNSYIMLFVPNEFSGKRTILIDRLSKFIENNPDDKRVKLLERAIKSRMKLDRLAKELDNDEIKYYNNLSDELKTYGKNYLDYILNDRDDKFYESLKSLVPNSETNLLKFKSISISDEMKEIIINEVNDFVMKRLNSENISDSDIIHWVEETSKDIFSEDEKQILIDGNCGNIKRKTIYLNTLLISEGKVRFSSYDSNFSFNVEVFDVDTDDGIVSDYIIDYLNYKLKTDGDLINKYVRTFDNDEKNYFENKINILRGIEYTDDINGSLGLVLSYIYNNDCSEEFKNLLKDIIC